MSGLTRASIRLGAFGAVVIIGASLLRDRYRNIETAAAVGLVNLFGGPHHTHLLGHSVLVSPGGHVRFVAVVTLACSSLPAVLCLLCISSLLPGRVGRRTCATAAALAAVVAGNVIRIGASLGVGVIAGRASLVLFHDSVGTVVTFASTLAGFIIMLMVLLPAERDEVPLTMGAP